jgi:hypothetical protein
MGNARRHSRTWSWVSTLPRTFPRYVPDRSTDSPRLQHEYRFEAVAV